jgi:hypothetical protein
MAAQMSRAEADHLREPDDLTADEEPKPDPQFLAWDPEMGVWRLMTIAQLSGDVQNAHYCGTFPVTGIVALDPDGSADQVAVHLQAGPTTTDDDCYMHTRYEVRGEGGELFGVFTTRIDGRS